MGKTIDKTSSEIPGSEKVCSAFIDAGTAASDPSIEPPLKASDHNPIVSTEKEPDETVEGEKFRNETTVIPHEDPNLSTECITSEC